MTQIGAASSIDLVLDWWANSKSTEHARLELYLKQAAAAAAAGNLLVYEMFSGRRPFERTDFAGYRQAHLHETASPLARVSNAPAAISNLVERCLAKRPQDRIQDFKTVGAELAAISAVLGTTTSP